jgi:phosphoglycolate phosphatase-like HAD superfamily hydrolase
MVAVFDCDGVLLDSNPVKIDAFRAALRDEPVELVERMIAEHRRSGGVSRFRKLEWFYRELRVVEDVEGAVAKALERFAKAAREGLRRCPAIPGVEAVLRRMKEEGTEVHVISGGEESEVREALMGRGWGEYFAGIHGSPTSKREHMQRLRDAGQLPVGGVYYGDAELDMRVAEEFGLRFVFVAAVSDWPEGRTIAAERGHTVIEDLQNTLP